MAVWTKKETEEMKSLWDDTEKPFLFVRDRFRFFFALWVVVEVRPNWRCTVCYCTTSVDHKLYSN